MTIDTTSDIATLLGLGDLPTLTVTLLDGANTKAGVTAVRVAAERAGAEEDDQRAGLDADRCAFLVTAASFASGFSTTNPVAPSRGLVVTPTGESPWTVLVARLRGAGAYYRLDSARRRQPGAA